MIEWLFVYSQCWWNFFVFVAMVCWSLGIGSGNFFSSKKLINKLQVNSETAAHTVYSFVLRYLYLPNNAQVYTFMAPKTIYKSGQFIIALFAASEL